MAGNQAPLYPSLSACVFSLSPDTLTTNRTTMPSFVSWKWNRSLFLSSPLCLLRAFYTRSGFLLRSRSSGIAALVLISFLLSKLIARHSGLAPWALDPLFGPWVINSENGTDGGRNHLVIDSFPELHDILVQPLQLHSFCTQL